MSKSQTNGNHGPLNGIKVVDLTRYAAGPTCTMILSDMGAETLKVEEPGKGDLGRASVPLVDDISGYFPYYNRNKKSITLNLRKDKGQEILHRLIQWGDVLVENYRPGFMKRIGFDYPAVREINPRIIMASISAAGQTGPYAKRAGFDTVGQALGGIMSLTGSADSPTGTGGPIADLTAGIFGALGTVLALYHRQSTGLGQQVESSLMESIVFFLGLNLVFHARGHRDARRGGRSGPAGIFQAKDGPYIVIMAHDNHHWPLMADIMGRHDLADSPGYRTRAERAKHGEELYDLIEAWARSNVIDDIEAVLDKAGLPYGRVQTVADLLKDPHLKARGTIKEFDHYGEVLPLFGPYPLLSDSPGSIRTPCPKLGQHNEEIYCGLLGFSQEELTTLKSEDVI